MKRIFMLLASVIIIILGSIIIYIKRDNDKKQGNKPFYFYAGTVEEENENYNKKIITNYTEYKEILDLYEMQADLKESDFDKYDYLALFITLDSCGEEIESVEDASYTKNIIKVTLNMRYTCGVCTPLTKLYFIRFNKKSTKGYKNVDIKYNTVSKTKCEPNTAYKPVIYLYPVEDTDISVKLSKPDNILVSYPKYNDEWHVHALKDGTLYDNNGRSYYALYWEGITYNIDNNIKEGFVVKGEDTIDFLEEKLSLLGLNERESNEFIMYWLPILEKNNYNYIRFVTREEIDNSNSLTITPNPDTIIRVLMAYKPLDEKINVVEQKIITPKRNGFTVVEWGGTKLDV